MPRLFVCLTLILALTGCEDQTRKSPNSIVGKTTQDVGKFDPNAKNVVSDSKVRVDTPGLSGLQAYGPMMEQISKSYILQAVNIFHATNDRYPKDYEEFMEQIIKANNIKLPVLPGGMKYQYDEVNHTLVVVQAPTEAPASEAPSTPK